MRPTSFTVSDEAEVLDVVIQSDLQERMTDLRHEADGFQNPTKSWNSYLHLNWHPIDIDSSTGKRASVATPDDMIVNVVRANGLALLTAPSEQWPSLRARAGYSAAPAFSDSETVTFVFKANLDFEGMIEPFAVRCVAPLIVGFNSLECFVELPFGDGKRSWLRPPNRKSLLPSLPRDILFKITRTALQITQFGGIS